MRPMAGKSPFPVLADDGHLCETRDACARRLPDRHKGATGYVDLRGRTKIEIRDVIGDRVPTPTFAAAARPGAQEDYFRNGNPEGRSYRAIVGESKRSIPAFLGPEPRPEPTDSQVVNPFREGGRAGDTAGAVGAAGVDRLLSGFGRPHPDGPAEPRGRAGHPPSGLPRQETAGIAGGNPARVMPVPATV